MATDFGSALTAAFQGDYVAHLSGGSYAITSPIVIHVTHTMQGPVGIDGGGATLLSQVGGSQPLIQIIVDPGVDFRYLTLSNFAIQGNGAEGDGIQLIADGNDRWLYNWTISNVTVQNVGGYGLDVQGSVFEGMVSNSWMNGNGLGGAYFAHSAGGGQVSALKWFGGGLQSNGGAGLTLANGARDMSVYDASVVNNNGPGISALSGITAVTGSDFENNHGPGVVFQNYGNFNNDTFSTSGSQSVGILGGISSEANIIGSTNTYTGSGTDPTLLANIQGTGGLFMSGDVGRVVTGGGVIASGPGGGNLTHVTVSGQGVSVPALAPVTAATTAGMPNSTGTGTLESALDAAFAGGSVPHLSATTYTVTTPIVINLTGSISGPVGIDLGGAKIFSQVGNGQPVIEIIVGPGVNIGTLTLANFYLVGNTREGDGIKIVADGSDRSIQNLNVTGVNVENVGGIGLDVIGNVHGTVFDSWMQADLSGGARFANSANGGLASGLQWIGGGFRKNGVGGLILDNGAQDMSVKGAYFVDNFAPGIVATSGITLVQASGFENNQGTGAIVNGSATFSDDTFSTYGPQTVGIGGYLAGGRVTVIGSGDEYYGGGADPTSFINLQGSGMLAVAGIGNVVVGPGVAVTGASTTVTPPSSVMIEATGATSLVQVGINYFLLPTGGSAGPELRYLGAGVAAGQFGAWVPLGAEKTASGYEVAWKVPGTDQYNVWNTDGAGNELSVTGVISGASFGLQAAETVLGQDLNGDGKIGVAVKVIEAIGSTSPVQVANNYALFPTGGSSGPFLRYAGAPVAAGQFGAWVPIGAEKTASGYEVAWKATGADQYIVWNTDSAGNETSMTAVFSGASFGLQAAEPVFGQDLNGDGVIGVAAKVIEAIGSTSLVQVANNYALFPAGGTSGPFVTYGGTPVVAGQFGAWMPIGAEKTASGYQVAWKVTGADQYIVWNTDNAGNETSMTSVLSGASFGLQAAEPAFGQDLNGDGKIGVAVKVIEAVGATSLVQVANDYALFPTGGTSGPFVSYAGAPVVTGQFGAWAPLGAEKTAGGYQVVWKVAGADQYIAWITDGAGNELSMTSVVSGASSTLKALEPAFGQDFNGDGVIGTGAASALLAPMSAAVTADPTASATVTVALAHDTGSSATDAITSDPTLVGTASPGSVVHFTVDGSAVGSTATANGSGAWTYSPNLSDGAHTIVAGATDGSGNTTAASLTFTLDTHAPGVVITGAAIAGATTTLSGTSDGAGDTVSLYDGNTWLGFATSDANGNWSFNAPAAPDVVHQYGAGAFDRAGNTGAASNTLIVGSTGSDSLNGGPGNDVIVGNGGNDRITGAGGADRLTGGPGNVTFSYNAASESTAAAPDLITDFRHGADKIDFNAISGINATNGVPQFQGNITGSGALTLNAHSVAYIETGGNTQVLVNTTGAGETVSIADTHAADMKIVLLGVNLGLTGSDFHHA
jgi:hypothetical protein